jgi:hypothetical protein
VRVVHASAREPEVLGEALAAFRAELAELARAEAEKEIELETECEPIPAEAPR